MRLTQNLPHPWVVIDDAHINVVGVWEHLHRFTRPGDYYIMEDTNPLGPAKLTVGYSAPGFKGTCLGFEIKYAAIDLHFRWLGKDMQHFFFFIFPTFHFPDFFQLNNIFFFVFFFIFPT